MAAARIRLANPKLLRLFADYKMHNRPHNLCYCTKPPGEDEGATKNLTGFASFYEQQDEFTKEPEAESQEKETFASLLRKSKFIDLGDPEGKIVTGTIYHVVEDDLYIDFGWKFPTVCKKPMKNQTSYTIGAKVKLLVKDLELSTKFLGSKVDTTLLEADCVLLGLLKQ